MQLTNLAMYEMWILLLVLLVLALVVSICAQLARSRGDRCVFTNDAAHFDELRFVLGSLAGVLLILAAAVCLLLWLAS